MNATTQTAKHIVPNTIVMVHKIGARGNYRPHVTTEYIDVPDDAPTEHDMRVGDVVPRNGCRVFVYRGYNIIVSVDALVDTPTPTVESEMDMERMEREYHDAYAEYERESENAAYMAEMEREIEMERGNGYAPAPVDAPKPKCDRCGGRGIINQFRHVQNGVCFKCGGNRGR